MLSNPPWMAHVLTLHRRPRVNPPPRSCHGNRGFTSPTQHRQPIQSPDFRPLSPLEKIDLFRRRHVMARLAKWLVFSTRGISPDVNKGRGLTEPEKRLGFKKHAPSTPLVAFVYVVERRGFVVHEVEVLAFLSP